jgi:hypothetical protein
MTARIQSAQHWTGEGSAKSLDFEFDGLELA